MRRKLKNEIPDYYYAQVQQQMAVLRLLETHFVQYIPPTQQEEGQLTISRVFFDRGYWKEVVVHIHEFYETMKKFYEQLALPLGSDISEKVKESPSRKRKRTPDMILSKKCI